MPTTHYSLFGFLSTWVAILLSFSAHAADPNSAPKSKTLKNSETSKVLRSSKKAAAAAPKLGCTYPSGIASNADPTATVEDGTCNFDAYIISRPEGAL